jgi:hypothetical protein
MTLAFCATLVTFTVPFFQIFPSTPMKNLLLFAFASVLSLVLPACGDKKEDAKPTAKATSITLEMNMIGFQNMPNAGASAVGGLAQTEAGATRTDGLVRIRTSSAEVQHGAQPAEVKLEGKRRGDKLWLYMNCTQDLRPGQVITYKLSTPESRYFFTYEFTSATPRANGRTVVEVTIP